MLDDEFYMRIALEEAKKGVGLTTPNPPVGAVIVKDKEEISRGRHEKAGEAHAERAAILNAISLHKEEKLKGATIYVTLEPCSTKGRTGACCDLLIEYEFARVVYGAIDPNPAHIGKADVLLGDAGIQVTKEVLKEECEHLIRAFSKIQKAGQPWVIAKTAMTLDGRITRPPEEGQWLSNEKSRASVQPLRCEVGAIITSGETVRKDDPKLTLRGSDVPNEKKQPWRVVLTRQPKSSFSRGLALFSDAYVERTLVYESTPIEKVLEELAQKGVHSVLLEAGGNLLGAFQDKDLIDEYVVYLAPIVSAGPDVALGGEGVEDLESFIEMHRLVYEKIGDDVVVRGIVKR